MIFIQLIFILSYKAYSISNKIKIIEKTFLPLRCRMFRAKVPKRGWRLTAPSGKYSDKVSGLSTWTFLISYSGMVNFAQPRRGKVEKETKYSSERSIASTCFRLRIIDFSTFSKSFNVEPLIALPKSFTKYIGDGIKFPKKYVILCVGK